MQGKSFEAELDEKIVFDQLDGSVSAVWSLLLATGYLKVLDLKYVGEQKKKVYTLALTNMEAESIFENMVKGWFGGNTETYYNEFINALLNDNVRKMNKIKWHSTLLVHLIVEISRQNRRNKNVFYY